MLRNFAYIFLSAMIGFALGISIRISIDANRFIVAEWSVDPVVVVCSDSSLTSYRVAKAIEWWGIREKHISYYHFDHENEICGKRVVPKGIILIRSSGVLPQHTYAVTTRFAKRDEMISAIITLPNQNNNMPRLLEHELGHALGMAHVDVVGHIMNPTHEYGGENFWIP
jgi:hypothetical protein